MCGIAGFFSNKAQLAPSVLEAMTRALVHRGPDDRGYFAVGAEGGSESWKQEGGASRLMKLGLGFRRLSILDLSENGAQPMQTPDGRYTIVFNGEIYNFPELKEELPGVAFRSQGDSEVLLHYLARFGRAGIERLNGIFAFAFHDRETGELLLARDPLGVKPLYYFEDERGFFFSSEIRSLAQAMQGRPRLRLPLLTRYLINNWIPDPDTLFEGIRRVEPGHGLSLRPGGQAEGFCYWDLSFHPDESKKENEWEELLSAAIEAAVRRQIRSDVPVAFFLSGGVDSSLLAARASLMLGVTQPSTFTIGFKWARSPEANQDLECARLLKARFPFDYRELILDPEIVTVLPRVVHALEEPIADPAALCSYLICEAAAREFKVLISGQGADELFGGYPVYQAGWAAAQLQRLPSPVRGFLGSASSHLPYRLAGRRLQGAHRIRKISASLPRPWPEPFCILRSALREEEASALLAPSVRSHQDLPFARQLELFARAAKWDRWHQMLYLDSKTYLPALNLTYSDKTSMAHSVELRVPFLDQQIVRLVERLPSRLKARPSGSKILLKRVADRVLPREIVHRRKAGFGLPLRDWFMDELQPMAADLLSEARLRRQGIFEAELPSRWLREHREMEADHSMRLYSLMGFQLWLDDFQVRL